MRKLTQKQLEKVQYADLSNLTENGSFIIPKREKTNVELGAEYILELASDLLVKGKNDVLESNYNRGRIPLHKYIHGEVEAILGPVILFTGYYSDGINDLSGFWRGYLPKSKVKIIKRYECK